MSNRTKRIILAVVFCVLFMLQGYGRLSQSHWTSLLGWFALVAMPAAVWWWILVRNPNAPLQSQTPADRRRNRWQILLMGTFGVFLIAAPFYWGPPSLEELVPAEGTLVSYSFYQTSGRNASLFTVFKIAGQSGRFWNDAVKNGTASMLAGHVGQTVKVLYQPHARISPMAGDAVKSY